ncbi:MAG: hypothetical protein LC667_18145 [Thioalkalivibrio sp.]|nr:hypothetical protein [Thioalkalivibrio sp.]
MEKRFGTWSARNTERVREPGPVLDHSAALAPEPQVEQTPGTEPARCTRATAGIARTGADRAAAPRAGAAGAPPAGARVRARAVWWT